MLKKTLIAAMLFSSVGANAHSQIPRHYKKVVLTEKVAVPITVQNLNSYAQTYEVMSDEKKLGEITLKPNEKRKFNVTVRVSDTERWVKKEISTRSKPREGQTVITHIFTTANLFRASVED
ncbi:hypothetical protein [Vibrio panuliri]|uniref:Uncharacterized protein n=1 Tax=Vibrio panuliri TaxID=1381081 RepID=A0A1Q9HP79_9VIBR|nr:hypothetical protein [Vibrio panuliri]KAB1455109.1 hypothetical protein F7O85_19905 [Vibrio panuliri]OLQ92668.1 hypothetical protein BIY22_15200 [Vibrio panuliri]OLQ94837.1 hypothetical protein BIY20_00665 [Vibrio panuliri]